MKNIKANTTKYSRQDLVSNQSSKLGGNFLVTAGGKTIAPGFFMPQKTTKTPQTPRRIKIPGTTGLNILSIITFGKYKNQKVIDLIQTPEGYQYLAWIQKKTTIQFGQTLTNAMTGRYDITAIPPLTGKIIPPKETTRFHKKPSKKFRHSKTRNQTNMRSI